MEKTVGAFEARRQFGQILKQVSAKGDSYVVEYHGEPVAAVVPIELYAKWKQRREAFFEHMRETAARANVPYDEAASLIEEAIQAVRREQT
ncbi:MAG: type II toxin-antitoxin system Phd/YefM family antitoxin [Chloroflexota bacterium]|nr:type II toxin-antitoxin system Phd/YefM family antitoxin [Chloroflexota bacterium]